MTTTTLLEVSVNGNSNGRPFEAELSEETLNRIRFNGVAEFNFLEWNDLTYDEQNNLGEIWEDTQFFEVL